MQTNDRAVECEEKSSCGMLDRGAQFSVCHIKHSFLKLKYIEPNYFMLYEVLINLCLNICQCLIRC